ncbi:hypothetical protein RsoM2USA_232 [Ralstonia phage RsoM2USA]|nr:hypothetical protein RsoM2USA_232 [Ralstonia phage RsoM2USA]
MKANTEKNQGWHYDTSPMPRMVKTADGKYELVGHTYHKFDSNASVPLTTAQYIDILITVISGVPIDQLDITITTDQLDALKRRHGNSIGRVFTQQ